MFNESILGLWWICPSYPSPPLFLIRLDVKAYESISIINN